MLKLPVRHRTALSLPGLDGVARVERRTRLLLPRLRPGDIAVIDHVDLDRATAQALVDAEVAAVVNAAPMISGRFPNLGPQTLVSAGILVIDSITTAGLAAIEDGSRVRLHDGSVYVGEESIAGGRTVDADLVAAEMEGARAGLVTQLASFTHNSTEFLRREQDLLLHGTGVPRLATKIAGRPVVVVTRGYDHEAELARLRTFLREQHPVVVSIGAVSDSLHQAGLKPDVVVVDAGEDAAELPSAATLRAARDVVVRADRGSGTTAVAQLERLGIRPHVFESAAAPEDAALILADAAEASVIVSVGTRATLEEFLDSGRPGLASAYLTRLKVGPRLVDASVLPQLYAGRVRPWHLMLILLAGLVALGAAVAVTPVGQEWVDTIRPQLADLIDSVTSTVQGLFT